MRLQKQSMKHWQDIGALLQAASTAHHNLTLPSLFVCSSSRNSMYY
jgi:hypothetical protein